MNGTDHGTHWWDNQTVVHPVGLAALVLLALVAMSVRRRYALAPVIILACAIPAAQRVAILTLDFTFLRLLLIFLWARILFRGEYRGFRAAPLDVAFTAWIAVGSLIYVIREASVSAIIFRSGITFDALGYYFAFRLLVRNWKDFDRLVQSFALISLPTAAAFFIEWTTARNPFAVFGGVPEITVVRDGRLRCRGAFPHPILAGSFWATILPLVVARFWRPTASKVLTGAATAAILFIVIVCASSTPLMGLVLGAIAAAAYPLRHNMQLIRWGAVATVAGLAVVMDAPVWHLVSRVNVVGGSTGWHRFKLVDEFVNRVGEWWLLGTSSTAHWGRQLFDVTNYYVAQGVGGGILTLILFLTVLALAFHSVGKLISVSEPSRPRVVAAWALGVSLFIHAGILFATSYFGQMLILWFGMLGLVAGMTPARQPSRRRQHIPASARRRSPYPQAT